MKVVINACYGGFSLSPLAIKRLAELRGKECYFFKHNFASREYEPITLEQAEKTLFCSAYSVPNPQDFKINEADEDGLYRSANERAKKIGLEDRDVNRADEMLIKVVEELGDKAGGRCAKLEIIEIPDGTDYIVEEYDGYEHIAEKHRTWG